MFFPNKFFKMPHCFILVLSWKRRRLKYKNLNISPTLSNVYFQFLHMNTCIIYFVCCHVQKWTKITIVSSTSPELGMKLGDLFSHPIPHFGGVLGLVWLPALPIPWPGGGPLCTDPPCDPAVVVDVLVVVVDVLGRFVPVDDKLISVSFTHHK